MKQLGVDPKSTSRRISGVNEKKSLVFDLLRNFMLQIAEKVFKIDCFVVEGSSYDVIIYDTAMENLKGVLDIGKQLASFIIDGEVVRIPIGPDYV